MTSGRDEATAAPAPADAEPAGGEDGESQWWSRRWPRIAVPSQAVSGARPAGARRGCEFRRTPPEISDNCPTRPSGRPVPAPATNSTSTACSRRESPGDESAARSGRGRGSAHGPQDRRHASGRSGAHPATGGTPVGPCQPVDDDRARSDAFTPRLSGSGRELVWIEVSGSERPRGMT
jgi:hypothetical protein